MCAFLYINSKGQPHRKHSYSDACGKAIKAAKSGTERGSCTRDVGHSGNHGNETCPQCGVASTCGWCRKCYRNKYNMAPKNWQTPGSFHCFPCGCSGILPQRGESNKFAKDMFKKVARCRVGFILMLSQHHAKENGCAPIDSQTPHSVIRKLMEEENCCRCHQPLVWAFGNGKTPHLHHNHESGGIYGFTHPRCNPRALEHEINDLRHENEVLRQRIRELEERFAIAA